MKTRSLFASLLVLLMVALLSAFSPAVAQAASGAGASAPSLFGDLLDGGSLIGLLLGIPFLGTVRNFVPQIWSQNLNLQMRKARRFSALTNRDYEGEIANAGDTVKITRPGSVEIRDYDGQVTYDETDSAQQVLVVDQSRYFGFSLDDVDKAQANVNLNSTYTEEAGQSMADDTDRYIAGHYAEVGAANVIAKSVIDKDNVYGAFVTVAERLDAENVPSTGRVAIISARMLSFLRQADEFIKASDLGDNVVVTGAIGMAAGFSLFQSNNVAVASDGTDDVEHNLFGTSAAITFADQLVQMEALRLESKFGDGIRGLHLYGSKVIRPEALVDLRRTA